MIGSLVSLAIMGALVYGLVRILRGQPADAGRPSGEDLRESVVRFFRLALLAAVVVLVAEGTAGLIGELEPRSDELTRDPVTVARALAFTVVGVPVLLGLASWTRRRLTIDPAEARSTLWGGYLTGVVLLSLLVGMSAWYELGRWAVGAGGLGWIDVGRVLAWTPVWVLHWRLVTRRPTPAGRLDLQLVVGSGIALVILAIGVGLALGRALQTLYDAAFLTLVVSGGTEAMRRSIAAAVVGALVWWWYWVRHSATGPRSQRWYAYVLLLGVLGGLVTAVVGAAQLLHTTLQWGFGDPGPGPAATHFAVVPGSLATVVVGVVGWWYHRTLLHPVATRERSEIDRIYRYLAAGVGLVAAAVGVTAAVAALLEALAGSSSLTDRTPLANEVVFAVTMLLVGGPIWGWYWRGAQREAAVVVDRQSVTRRVYLLLLFGAAAVVALVSLVVLLFLVFEDVAGTGVGTSTVLRIRVPVGLVLTAGAVAGYHALVYREDRDAAPAPAPRAPAVREVVLVTDNGEAVAAAIADEVGARVRMWRPVTEAERPVDTGAMDAAEVVAAVRAVGVARVLVLGRPGGGFEVVPFREE